MITKEQWEQRQREWAEFERWKAAQPLDPISPERGLAIAGALYQWLPESTRQEDRDPERLGIRRMHRLLEILSSR